MYVRYCESFFNECMKKRTVPNPTIFWSNYLSFLTHLSLVLHICVSELGSALVQMMACRLFGAKPLSETMLGFCELDLEKQI